MIKRYEGGYDAAHLRIAVVVARFNEVVSSRLLDGALEALRRHGVHDEDVSVAWVPGAFELPLVAGRFAESGEVDAVVCLGTVIRGETAHFDYVAGHAARGVGKAAVDTGIPITFGVLTTEDAAQAIDRAGGKHGNKGAEAARAAIEMASLMADLPKPAADR